MTGHDRSILSQLLATVFCVALQTTDMLASTAAEAGTCGDSVESLRGDLADGRTTPIDIARAVLTAQENFDRAGPRLASTPFPNTRMLDEARGLQSASRSRPDRRPLFAIPINVKDMIDVAGLPTSVGEPMLAATVATQDSVVVARLRRAGALITGKGSVNAERDPWLSGFHGFGLTVNPYSEALDPQGSSTGTAVAVASGQAVAGIGEETTDSLRGVADALGLVSIRPTFGRVPTEGMYPFGVDRDVIGVLGKSVADAALVANVIAGCHDAGRPCSPAQAVSLRGLRLGVPLAYVGKAAVPGARPLPFDPEVLARFEAVLSVLRRDGAEIVDVPTPLLTPTDGRLLLSAPYYRALGFPPLDAKAFEDLYAVQSAQETDRYLKRRNGNESKGLQALAAKAGEWPEPVHAFYRANVAKMAQLAAAGLTAEQERTIAAYEAALDRLYRAQVQSVMAAGGIDAFVHPTAFRPVMTVVGALRDPHGYEGENVLAMAVADFGLPAVTVPMGQTAAGIPLTVTFAADRHQDERVVAIAARYEQLSLLYRPPEMCITTSQNAK
jgi:Asp-tRNA(Asn)/Glu-tRNA(Gln) amidotransferase A subunit family amidase